MDTRWRFNGHTYEHQCGDAQAGYFVALRIEPEEKAVAQSDKPEIKEKCWVCSDCGFNAGWGVVDSICRNSGMCHVCCVKAGTTWAAEQKAKEETVEEVTKTLEGHPEFHKILDEMRALHEKKAADYGTRGGDPLANLRASEAFGIPAWVGSVMRCNDKMKRVQSFVKNGELANESIEDSLADGAAYFILALILYREVAGKPKETT